MRYPIPYYTKALRLDYLQTRRDTTPLQHRLCSRQIVLATNPSASALLRFQYNNRIITPFELKPSPSSAAQASPAAPPPTITTEASARSQPGRLAFFMTWTKKQRNQLPTSKRNQMNTLLFLARSLSLSFPFPTIMPVRLHFSPRQNA